MRRLLLALALGLGACAQTPSPGPRTPEETAKIIADTHQRLGLPPPAPKVETEEYKPAWLEPGYTGEIPTPAEAYAEAAAWYAARRPPRTDGTVGVLPSSSPSTRVVVVPVYVPRYGYYPRYPYRGSGKLFGIPIGGGHHHHRRH